jgi:glucose uptake protein GlcU
MRSPLILAHGQDVLPVFLGMVLCANIAAFASIAVAKQKANYRRSIICLALAIVGLLLDGPFLLLAFTGVFRVGVLIPVIMPVILSVIGGILCARKIKHEESADAAKRLDPGQSF